MSNDNKSTDLMQALGTFMEEASELLDQMEDILLRAEEGTSLDDDLNPRFSIREFSRRINGREFGGQIEGIGCIPKAFHPYPLLHG